MTHRRSTGRRGLITLLVAAAIIVGGCGGGNGTTTSPGAVSTAPAVSPATDGALYRDASGVYTMRVPDDWSDGSLQSPKIWLLGTQRDGFRTNVNVIVEKLPTGIGLERYVEASIQNAPRLIEDFSLISSETIDLPSGQPGARLRFSGTGQGRTIMFMQVIAFDEGNAAAVATLTAVPELIDSAIDSAEPSMRTLEVVGSP